MKEMFATITGFTKYGGLAPFKLGGLVRCEKEPDNAYDGEAIKCTLPLLGAVGYIANSTSTVVGGTMSAGRLYDKVDSKFYIRVLFMTHSSVICRVEKPVEFVAFTAKRKEPSCVGVPERIPVLAASVMPSGSVPL